MSAVRMDTNDVSGAFISGPQLQHMEKEYRTVCTRYQVTRPSRIRDCDQRRWPTRSSKAVPANMRHESHARRPNSSHPPH